MLCQILQEVRACRLAAMAGRPVPIESLFNLEAMLAELADPAGGKLARVHQLARRNAVFSEAAMEITSGSSGNAALLSMASVCHRDASEASSILAGLGVAPRTGVDDLGLLHHLSLDPSMEIRVSAHLAAEKISH